MHKSRNMGAVCAARPAFMPEIERELLSHVELCYSVALALTRDPILGQRLARATLLWAWQRQAVSGDLDTGDIKMVLLKELRGRFLRDYFPLCSGELAPAADGAIGVGHGRSKRSPKKREKALCAVGVADHDQTRVGE